MAGRTWRGWASAAVMLAAGVGAGAEAIEIRAELPKGRMIPLEVVYTVDLDRRGAEGAGSTKSLRQEAVIRFVVEDVAEDGSAVLTGDVERLMLEWANGEQRGEFIMPRVTADVPAETPTNRALQALGEAIMSAPIQIVMSPDGRVEAIRGLNDVLMTMNDPRVRGEGPIPLVDTTALGIFGARQLAAMAESAFTADGAGDVPREVGDTWETSESIPTPPAGTVVLKTEWTLASVDGDLATVMGTPHLTISPPESPDAPDPTAPKGEVKEQEATVTLVWNLAERAIERRDSSQRVTTHWTMAGMSLEQDQTATMSITRRAE